MPYYFSRGTIAYTPDTKCLYTQLAGLWALFAFILGVLLPSVDDVVFWRRACLGCLLVDVSYFYSMSEGGGGWGGFLNFATYTAWDWYTLLASVALTLVRFMVVLGVGVKGEGEKKKI